MASQDPPYRGPYPPPASAPQSYCCTRTLARQCTQPSSSIPHSYTYQPNFLTINPLHLYSPLPLPPRFLPVLKDMPAKYIYEPWTAPLEVQRKAGCIIGRDYPFPIVDHATVHKANISRMAEAYKANKWVGGPWGGWRLHVYMPAGHSNRNGASGSACTNLSTDRSAYLRC